MRWSLILSSFIAVQSALSFICVALAIPPSSDGLERRRAPKDPVKEPSKKYRNNAKNHQNAYHFANLDPNGKIRADTTVTKTKLKEEDRLAYGEGRLKAKGSIHAGTLLRLSAR